MQELYTALAKAQAEIPIISKNKTGRFKYADLAEIIYVIKPILAKNGLSLKQDGIRNDDGSLSIKTIICHSSGQETSPSIWPVPLPQKEELKGITYVQAFAANASYIRRHSLGAILNIGISDEDYDGSYDQPPQPQKYYSQPSAQKVSQDQLNEILHHIGTDQDLVRSIYKKYEIDTLADLPAPYYRPLVDRLMEIKKTKEK